LQFKKAANKTDYSNLAKPQEAQNFYSEMLRTNTTNQILISVSNPWNGFNTPHPTPTPQISKNLVDT
jgi:predicted dinucleotide-binding enzyme